MDNADQTNQVIRDARDNFEFRLTTLQDAENAANPALAIPAVPLAVPGLPVLPLPSASALPKLELPVFNPLSTAGKATAAGK